MFQPISGVIANYYNVTDNQVIWLAQVKGERIGQVTVRRALIETQNQVSIVFDFFLTNNKFHWYLFAWFFSHQRFFPMLYQSVLSS